jgi:hypothetical protein
MFPQPLTRMQNVVPQKKPEQCEDVNKQWPNIKTACKKYSYNTYITNLSLTRNIKFLEVQENFLDALYTEFRSELNWIMVHGV